MEKKEAIQWTGKNFDAVMQFAGEDGGHKLAYEDAEEEAYKTGRIGSGWRRVIGYKRSAVVLL